MGERCHVKLQKPSLVTATNPETGETCYGLISGATCTEKYDGNGNLLNKTDSRGVITTYSYDALNRMATKSYVVPASTSPTPFVTFTYDASNPNRDDSTCNYNLGRLTGVFTGSITLDGTLAIPPVAENTYYDALGRPCASQQQQQLGSGPWWTFVYGYNLAGALKSESYPSGRSALTTSFDGQNRPMDLTGVSPTTYVRLALYGSNDALSQIYFGSQSSPIATETFSFDPFRQQPTLVSVAGPTGAALFSQTNNYYCQSTDLTCMATCPANNSICRLNNGNLQSAVISVPASFLKFTQDFGYDKLNRLTSAQEKNTFNTPSTARASVITAGTKRGWWSTKSPMSTSSSRSLELCSRLVLTDRHSTVSVTL